MMLQEWKSPREQLEVQGPIPFREGPFGLDVLRIR